VARVVAWDALPVGRLDTIVTRRRRACNADRLYKRGMNASAKRFPVARPTLMLAFAAAAFAASAFAPSAAGQASQQPAPPAVRLRVLTYNIHHGEGTDGKLDLARIAKVISGEKPDLVALQEVDVNTTRTGGVDQAAELARLTGMHVVFGKAIDYQGGAYGNAVLSRFPITSHAVHPLPAKEGSEKRCGLAAVVRPWQGGPALTFVSTHLDHLRDESDRLAQADALQQALLKDTEQATILAGDLNAVPGSETIKRFTGKWVDTGAEANAPTVPAARPNRRIDYVLLRPAAVWRAVETKVLEESVASDHRAVLAVVEWRGQPVVSDAVPVPRPPAQPRR
jgi:endonuclease/exonuclease/phosphatase family metal-dependent hydrolase